MVRHSVLKTDMHVEILRGGSIPLPSANLQILWLNDGIGRHVSLRS
jgi:hypothetical protein